MSVVNTSSFNKYNIPPPGGFLHASVKLDVAYINRLASIIPRESYIQGLPPSTLEVSPAFNLNYVENPFTYINISDIGNQPSHKITINLYNLPLGSLFIINGPCEWDSTPGILSLKDLQPDGSIFPNNEIEVLPTNVGLITARNQVIVRDSTGIVARAMN
jgi:hypothetical protein